MQVAIIIVGFQNTADIMRCLTALERSEYRDFQILICENGGAASFARLADAIPTSLAGGQKVRLTQAPHNGGYASGVNIGLRDTSSFDAWWILNPDTEPEPSALDSLVKRLGLGDCDAVGGVLCFANGRVQSYGGKWQGWIARSISIGIGDDSYSGAPEREIELNLDYISGASLLIGRRFLETVGPMREDYFLYCEEIEWCLRSRKLNMHLGFTSSARVRHHHGTTTGDSSDIKARSRMSVYLNERNKLLLTRDVFPARLFIAIPASFFLIVLRYGRHGAWKQLAFACQGWWAGLRNQRGAYLGAPT
jgi:N-acetylglucosaminyl-diphospho-decaprenol L-rhamnosyltransferase